MRVVRIQVQITCKDARYSDIVCTEKIGLTPRRLREFELANNTLEYCDIWGTLALLWALFANFPCCQLP